MDDLWALLSGQSTAAVTRTKGAFFLRAAPPFQGIDRTMMFGCSLEGPPLVEDGVDEMWICTVRLGLIERYRDTEKRFTQHRADQVLTAAYYDPKLYGAKGGGLLEEQGLLHPLLGTAIQARLFFRTASKQAESPRKRVIIAGTLIGDPGIVDRAIDEMWLTFLCLTPTRRFRDTKRYFSKGTIADVLTSSFENEQLYSEEVDLGVVRKSR